MILKGILAAVAFCLTLIRRFFKNSKIPPKDNINRKKKILFLHPYSHSMGGGERVLFTWISALSTDHSFESLICTGDDSKGFDEIEVRSYFHLALSSNCFYRRDLI